MYETPFKGLWNLRPVHFMDFWTKWWCNEIADELARATAADALARATADQGVIKLKTNTTQNGTTQEGLHNQPGWNFA